MLNVVAGARSSADHKSGTPDGDRMFEMVAAAGYGPKQQKAPEGANCMFGLVAGTRNSVKHTLAMARA